MNEPIHPPGRGLLSVRVIIEGLAVAGIIWLANSVQQQNTSIARLQVQITQVQASLAAVPTLTDRIAQNATTMAEFHAEIGAATRRLDRLESREPQQLKRWTK